MTVYTSCQYIHEQKQYVQPNLQYEVKQLHGSNGAVSEIKLDFESKEQIAPECMHI